MFIIDFDDTLFNTRPKFLRARIKALKKLGVSDQQNYDSYCKARRGPKGNGYYNSERQAEALGELGYDEEKIKSALLATETPRHLKTFLLTDAIKFLRKIKKLREPMVLLSLGNEEYQYKKVHGSRIEKYFDRIFFVNDSKEFVLGKLLKKVSDKKIWFINDRVGQTLELASKFKRITPILKQSVDGGSGKEYKNSGLPYFKTLTQIYNYVKKHK